MPAPPFADANTFAHFNLAIGKNLTFATAVDGCGQVVEMSAADFGSLDNLSRIVALRLIRMAESRHQVRQLRRAAPVAPPDPESSAGPGEPEVDEGKTADAAAKLVERKRHALREPVGAKAARAEEREQLVLAALLGQPSLDRAARRDTTTSSDDTDDATGTTARRKSSIPPAQLCSLVECRLRPA
jgi:hypothetical protein